MGGYEQLQPGERLARLQNPALLNGVLRDEWGFEGLVMRDWTASNQCSHAAAINSGNDLIMPGDKGVQKNLEEAFQNGELNRSALETSAARVLKLVFQSETCKNF